jgi:acyl-CoA-binding protein
MKTPSSSLFLLALLVLFCLLRAGAGVAQKPGFLTIKNGYFYDQGLKQHYFAKGIAYQTWIADLGEWQTDEQIDWDLREMAKMGSNSVRVDFVWKHIEIADNVFVWDRYDRLVGKSTSLLPFTSSPVLHSYVLLYRRC